MAAIIGNRNITLGVLGGTLITACAGFGGDVFGCSPYDAATTRYLKATYPLHWQAIRNFGFDNPQLVPWINEDNDLIVSLVGVGKERWLVNASGAYLDTKVLANSLPNLGLHITMRGLRRSTSNGALLAARDPRFWVWLWYSSQWDCCVGSDVYGGSVQANRIYDLEFTANTSGFSCLVDGVKIAGNSSTATTNRTMYMFANNAGSSVTYQADGKIAYCNIQDGSSGEFVDIRKYVPFKQADGTCEMLDLVSLTFAEKHGAFTIEMTDTPT